MNLAVAHSIVARERARWFACGARLSDDELLRCHERWYNGFTLFLAVVILPTWFCGGALGTLGVMIAIAGEVLIARHLSGLGNQCRDARKALVNRAAEQIS